MKRNNLLICVMVLCHFYTTRAELLIVQKGEDGKFIPLSAESGINDNIRTTLERYQWPQCINYCAQMTDQEKTELLSMGAAYAQAEERFIQSKLQEINNSYQVVFVPTALYELFTILRTFKSESENNPIEQEVSAIAEAGAGRRGESSHDKYEIDLSLWLNKKAEKKSFFDIMGDISKKYEQVNSFFFADGVWGYINNQFAQFLFSQYPELQTAENASAISANIKIRCPDITTGLISQMPQLTDVEDIPLMSKRLDDNRKTNLVAFLNIVQNESPALLNIIQKTIDLEYEAREINSALLLRGTSFEEMQVGFGTNQKNTPLAGSTVRKPYSKKEKPKPIEQIYKERQLKPYSISFGNSLFAGAVRDRGASAYYFLILEHSRWQSASVQRSVGYALFIDKKAYCEHRIHNLFFIPGLMTLAGLFEKGEFFHARTTAAVPIKEGKPYHIEGLMYNLLWSEILDPSGVLLITRDPLRHAELFSNYLAQHGRILQEGSLDQLTEEEQKFAQEVLTSQKEAAQFYKRTRRFKKVVDKKTERIRRAKAGLIDSYIRIVKHYEYVFNENARDKDGAFVARKQGEIRGLLADLENIKKQKTIKKNDLNFARRLAEQAGAIVKEVKPEYIIAIPREFSADAQVGVEEEVKVKEGE